MTPHPDEQARELEVALQFVCEETQWNPATPSAFILKRSHALAALLIRHANEALEEAALICDAKAVYANRSRHGKDEFTQGLLSELENILRDTAASIRSLRQAAGEGK